MPMFQNHACTGFPGSSGESTFVEMSQHHDVKVTFAAALSATRLCLGRLVLA